MRPPRFVPLAFLDPQYLAAFLDKLAYGNEGVNRGRARAALQQMDESRPSAGFIQAIDRVLAAFLELKR